MSAARYRALAVPLPRLRLRALALAGAGIRAGLRRKLPLLLLYGLPVGWTLFFCFQVYLRYAALEGGARIGGGGLRMLTTAVRLSGVTFEVKRIVGGYYLFSRLFTVLVMAWFGAGLLCEDRRAGAHLLYFSRPLTRLDYVLGRALTAFFFGALASLVPGLLICGAAAWSSPDWQFLEEEGEVVWGTALYGTLIAGFYTLLVLALSSLFSRKAWAMIATFASLLLAHGLSRVLWRVLDERTFVMVSPLTNLGRVGDAFLDVRSRFYTWPAEESLAVLAGIMVVCAVVIAVRVRRWEVVA